MVRRHLSLLCLFLPLILSAQGIGSVKDYLDFAKACNEGAGIEAWMDSDSVVTFTADLDFGKVKKLPQIVLFSGKLDAKGHSILNWKAQAGLFAETALGSEVRNLVIDRSCSAKLSSKSTEYNFGFIADVNGGLIEHCVCNAGISHRCSYTSNIIRIGGITGLNNAYVLDCTTQGKIVSYCSGVEQKSGLTLQTGGIVGGCTTAKKTVNAVVADCISRSEISVTSDFPENAVGGIVGLAGNCPVKCCANYGKVHFDGLKPESGTLVPQGRVAGVVGFTKNNVSGCDNYGEVSAGLYADGMCGGICGQPHTALVVADCVNCGRVSSSTECSSNVGGIAGIIGRPVHLRRCINRGEVAFEGFSQRTRSTAGGIVGSVYCPASSPEGTYIRNCANYGKVSSVDGGNVYTNANAIHTGGIVGFMTTREGYTSYLKDCVNEGEVRAAGGRRGNICASVNGGVRTGGTFPSDDALEAEPDVEFNVSGLVCDTEGKPVEGVVVTDGQVCVRTGADGHYRMSSDLSKTHFIYLSLPADASVPCENGIPQFYRRVARGQKAVRADFVLMPHNVSKRHTLLMIGDPQVRPYGMDGSMETWCDDVVSDAEAFRASCPGDVYCINLGDLVYNYMYAYDDYLDAASRIKCPTFNVMGNHDFDQTTMFGTRLGNGFFETYIGPDHYSFNIGDIHYVVVNSIIYDRRNASESYGHGLDELTMDWLENDLAFVPKDRTVVICSHAQLFKRKGTSPNGSHGAKFRNYGRYLKLLSSFAHVYSWSGHYHDNFYYNYASKDVKWGAPNIESICVARATGSLRFNKYLAHDGTPQGYMVVNVDGSRLDWYYKSVGRDKSFQMRVLPSQGDGFVRVNVWNWGEGWSVPKWYENGSPVCEMEYTPGRDPEYEAMFNAYDNKTNKKYCQPSDDCNIFRVSPTPGVKSGEIRVEDQFGNQYKTTISL